MNSGPTNPRVWIVSELYYPEDTSTGRVLTQLAEGLGGRFHMGAICGQPTYAQRGSRASRHEVRRGVEIYRCASTTLDKDVLPLRIVNMLTLSVSMLITCVVKFRSGDRVLVVTNPPLLPFATALACWLRGANFGVLVHDVYPDILIATGSIVEGGAAARLMDAFHRRLYRRARRVVVLGRDMHELFVAKYRQLSERFAIVTNWADVEDVHPIPRHNNEVIKELGLETSFIVHYAGNMGRTHAIEDLVDAAARVDPSEVAFLIAGDGAKRRWLERAVIDRQLSNVKLVARVPAEEERRLRHLLTAGDVAVIGFIPGMAGISVPSRMYNLLAAGMPIIAIVDRRSELARVVCEERVGWVVPPGDGERFVQAIEAARADPQQLQAMAERARQVAVSRYHFDQVSQGFVQIFAHDLFK